MMQSVGMEFDDLVEISRGRVLYVLEWNSEDADADGKKESFAIVVMRRAGGCLLALPQGFLSPEELSSAEVPGEMLGPSHSVLVQGVVMEDGIQTEIGAEVPVLLVDMDQSVAQCMRPPEEVEDLAHMFLPDDPFAFPKPDELVAKALEWLQSLELTDVEWYPTEVTASSGAGTPKRKAAPKRPKAAAVGDTALGKEKQKKATTATLAASLESVLETLPVLTEQMHEMMVRQKSLEEQVVANRTPAGVLTQPLSAALHATPKVAAMAKSFGSPPRVQRAPRLPVMRGGDPAPVLELQGEKREETSESDVARAMLAQSSALTTLVAHLAGSQLDPMQDLQGVTSGTRGASGRARLQAELAQQRGSFFHSVVLSMARRMSPTTSPDVPYPQLMAYGITGVKYLERFGGYGKQKDLGLVQYQLMVAFDFLMSENWEAAKDTVALLIVMIEQAVLDSGRFDLGQLLTLQEDPPASVFTNRQLSAVSRARAFSPLADQKWVTVALAFLKELDTISSKRVELIGQASSSGGGQPIPVGTPKVKGAPKKKGRGKGKTEAEEDQAAE